MENEELEENRSESSLSVVKTIGICLMALLIGGGAIVWIFWTSPTAQRGERPEPAPMLVNTTRVDSGTFRPRMQAMGTVVASEDVALSPRVGGQIIERSPHFTAGGFVEKGEVLVRIDPSDFENTIEQRKAELQQARAQYEIERGERQVALEEFELLDREIPEENRELILREPQMNSARAEVNSAKAALDQARLDYERTWVRAPFDAHVIQRSVSVGNEVSAGEQIGRLVSLDKFWVEATMELSKLRWLDFPDTPGDRGAPVRIDDRGSWKPGEYREGMLTHQIGELDDQSRMARVRILVEDPMAHKRDAVDSPSLVLGSYVRSEIFGEPIKDVVRIDRDLIREQDTVWLMEDGELVIRPVEILLRDRDYAYINDGLTGGEQIVTSQISTVVEGTPLRRNTGADTGENK